MSASPAFELPEDDALSCDRIAGDWVVWQLKRGHRFSADDMMTAWLAAEVSPNARDLLDLGAGIGSVGLMTLRHMEPGARLTMVEAQDISHALARRTIVTNGLQHRVEARFGDLRDPASVPEVGAFDLVTGSPPYIPLGKGVLSPVAQRAACRMELRGSIVDYAVTAARAMRPDGWFVACFAAIDPRGELAFEQAGLHLHIRRDVVFRAGVAPMITLLAGRHSPRPGGPDRQDPLVIRDETGAFTERYRRIRVEMGPELQGDT